MTTALSRRGAVPGRHVYDVITLGGQLGGALVTASVARPIDGSCSPTRPGLGPIS